MPTPNYDKTLLGRYIRAIENSDSVGFDKATRRWYAPTGSAYDRNSRGMGIDVENNKEAIPVVAGRKGKWLTE